MYTRPLRPIMLSLEELGSAAIFPAEAIHSLIEVEKCVMNERRSRLPSLGLLHTPHTTHCMLNVQRTLHTHTLSVPARLSRHSKVRRRGILADRANGSVKSSAKEKTSRDPSTVQSRFGNRSGLFDWYHHLPHLVSFTNETTLSTQEKCFFCDPTFSSH
ncbi:hypothetical protein EDD85DRAFT_152513 [Armillaria nabsnona]|nr:hypothetical protein EDD85DRAFT_152513 [Armillaria nabsnona]